MKKRLVRSTILAALACGMALLPSGAYAGASDGPVKHDDTVQARKIDVYHIKFNGEEQALVRAKAHGDDLDLYIYDAHDNLVTKDATNDDTPVCIWTPKWTGVFTIKIVNNENHPVDYIMETN